MQYKGTTEPIPFCDSQTFDSEGNLLEDPTMQALEVFCTCWFTFEVSRPLQARATSPQRCSVANKEPLLP